MKGEEEKEMEEEESTKPFNLLIGYYITWDCFDSNNRKHNPKWLKEAKREMYSFSGKSWGYFRTQLGLGL